MTRSRSAPTADHGALGRLPPGWVWARIKDVGELKLGRQRSPEHHAGPHMRPYLRVANVFEDRLDLSDVKSMNFTPEEFDVFRLEPGDVLLNEGQSPHLVGRPAMWRGEITGACFQNTLIRFRPHPGVVSGFALTVFRAQMHLLRYLRIAKVTTNIAHLGTSRLAEVEFPLAPTAEQRRIVAEIEKQFTRLDKAVATLEAVQTKLKRARASVLKTSVDGRLVPTEAELARAEGRSYEPASVLLERILEERKRRWPVAKRYQPPEQAKIGNLPSLPEGWTWATTQMLYFDAGYGTSQKCAYGADGPPVIRIPNIQNQALSLDDLKRASKGVALAQDGVLQPGDFLFIRTNGSRSLIGRGALVTHGIPGDCYFASYLIRLRIVPAGCLPRWLGFAWHSPTVRDQLLRDAVSSAGQHNVSLSAAARYLVPLPPAVEQERVLAEVERRLSVLDALEQTVERNLARCARLRQSILKRAFEGKLVPQDPNDEPASVLLARIRCKQAAEVTA